MRLITLPLPFLRSTRRQSLQIGVQEGRTFMEREEREEQVVRKWMQEW